MGVVVPLGTPQSGLDGVPPVGAEWGNPLTLQDRMGVPSPSPPTTPAIRRQNSRVSTLYATGGMPLVFTQENFLVKKYLRTSQNRVLFLYGATLVISYVFSVITFIFCLLFTSSDITTGCFDVWYSKITTLFKEDKVSEK